MGSMSVRRAQLLERISQLSNFMSHYYHEIGINLALFALCWGSPFFFVWNFGIREFQISASLHVLLFQYVSNGFYTYLPANVDLYLLCWSWHDFLILVIQFVLLILLQQGRVLFRVFTDRVNGLELNIRFGSSKLLVSLFNYISLFLVKFSSIS